MNTEIKSALKISWENNLKKYGVTFPTGDLLVALEYLAQNLCTLVPLSTIRGLPGYKGKSEDKQPRHLKYAGWDLRLSGKSGDRDLSGLKIPNGYIMLASITHPNTDFLNQFTKRSAVLNSSTFEDLKKAHNYKCACCGAEGPLEQGHKDPRIALSIQNTLPMCSSCNNFASKDLLFGDDGRIVAVLNERFLKKSGKQEQLKMFNFLKEALRMN